MPPLISWFLYLSWVFLFVCILSILKWLDIQPRAEQLRLSSVIQQPSDEATAPISMERALRIAIKTCLVLSIAFLVLHFIVLVAPRSHP